MKSKHPDERRSRARSKYQPATHALKTKLTGNKFSSGLDKKIKGGALPWGEGLPHWSLSPEGGGGDGTMQSSRGDGLRAAGRRGRTSLLQVNGQVSIQPWVVQEINMR